MLEPRRVSVAEELNLATAVISSAETEALIGGQTWRVGQLLAATETLFAQPPAVIRVSGGDPLTCWLGVLYALRYGCRLLLGADQTGKAAEVRPPANLAKQAKAASAELLAALNENLNSPDPRVALVTSGSTGEPTLVWKSWQVLAAEAASLNRFYHCRTPRHRGGEPPRGRAAAPSESGTPSPSGSAAAPSESGTPSPSGSAAAPSESVVLVSLVPPIHIYGLLHGILLPLLSGRPLIQVADVSLGLSPAEQARLSQHRSALLVTTPASWSRARQLIAADQVASLVTSAGAFGQKRHLELVAAVADRPFAAIELYGSTETGGLAWQDLLAFGGFTPFPEVTISHGPEATSAYSPYIYPGGHLQLDDRLAPEPGGTFRVLGRRDRVFKYGGKRYSLSAIATRLAAAAKLEPAQVICDFEEGADRAKGGLLWAFLEKGHEMRGEPSGEQVSLMELRTQFQAEGAPPLPFPDKLVAVAELPRTALGKVSLAELRKQHR